MNNTVVPGYAGLANVLQRAYEQASSGKGHMRHARDAEPFEAQVMLEGARRFGVGSLLFQAYKKAEESQRLKTGPATAELLGAIVYLAAAVIERERLDRLAPDGTGPQPAAASKFDLQSAIDRAGQNTQKSDIASSAEREFNEQRRPALREVLSTVGTWPSLPEGTEHA